MGQRVPPKSDAIGRRYSLLRERLGQEGTARQQREGDQLKRAEARSGMQGSGAFIKARERARNQREQEIGQAREGLDVAESGERFQQEQIKAQRDFQRSERLGSQDFAGQQAQLGRDFAKSERRAGQKFQSLEAKKQRGFSKGLFDREMQFKESQKRMQEHQFYHQMELATKKFDLDTKVSDFNMDMAKKQFDKQTLMESWFGAFGLDPRGGGADSLSGSSGTDFLGAAAGGVTGASAIGGGKAAKRWV